ncbi:HNH endonuclease [Erysipelotrichaceae bacterium NYU-BL-E8]|uniref:HNH endonuclease n=2 Tax=Ileibacterium valens TaxID=1862668 RepID=A0A1U7NHY0_9FIRM|nr:HNH endonuclease [Erysipelotrichaceae bacterium NYU-BL-E8]OLU41672.1 HNH endonuclease [Ileibacterium valens]OLU42876.1 HNH endonuclease [Erysipelotrichaceae bacterium NYU-BL-F16]
MPGVGSNARYGPFRQEYERNRKKILMSQNICALCGKPVDKSLKYPDPMSATIDHIIPIDRGGHPADIDNLQLAHMKCNRDKSNNLQTEQQTSQVSNRNLPWLIDWKAYRADDKASQKKIKK